MLRSSVEPELSEYEAEVHHAFRFTFSTTGRANARSVLSFVIPSI